MAWSQGKQAGIHGGKMESWLNKKIRDRSLRDWAIEATVYAICGVWVAWTWGVL